MSAFVTLFIALFVFCKSANAQNDGDELGKIIEQIKNSTVQEKLQSISQPITQPITQPIVDTTQNKEIKSQKNNKQDKQIQDPKNIAADNKIVQPVINEGDTLNTTTTDVILDTGIAGNKFNNINDNENSNIAESNKSNQNNNFAKNESKDAAKDDFLNANNLSDINNENLQNLVVKKSNITTENNDINNQDNDISEVNSENSNAADIKNDVDNFTQTADIKTESDSDPKHIDDLVINDRKKRGFLANLFSQKDVNKLSVQPVVLTTSNVKAIDRDVLKNLTQFGIYNDSCNAILKRLVVLKVKYKDVNLKSQEDGQIIVLDVIAPYVERLFNELYDINFTIGGVDPFKGAKVITPGQSQPDDNYNYTGSFSCRGIQSDKAVLSTHSVGVAIDINPLFNPYIEVNSTTKEITKVIPRDGVFHINRNIIRPGKENQYGIINKQIVKIFQQNGLNVWGGYWDLPIDNHHFQTSRALSSFLIDISKQDAEKFFALHVKFQECVIKKNNDDRTKILNDELITQINANLQNGRKYHSAMDLYNANQKDFFDLASQITKNYCNL